MLLIYIPEKKSEDIPEAGTSKHVLAEDFHPTPKRAISTPQSVRLVSKKVKLQQFSQQKRKFLEQVVAERREIKYLRKKLIWLQDFYIGTLLRN